MAPPNSAREGVPPPRKVPSSRDTSGGPAWSAVDGQAPWLCPEPASQGTHADPVTNVETKTGQTIDLVSASRPCAYVSTQGGSAQGPSRGKGHLGSLGTLHLELCINPRVAG